MSGSVKVSIRFVDGSLQEYFEGMKILSDLARLKRQGLEGKLLIHALLTDDWGPPPRLVQIKGVDESGCSVDIKIPYA